MGLMSHIYDAYDVFLLIAFLFLDIESDGDVFDDESNDDGSGSGFTIESSLSSLCPFF